MDGTRSIGEAGAGWQTAGDVVVLPMSFSQRQLWYLQRLTPSSAAYNIPFAIHIDGELDVAVLSRAFTALVDRHEVLRTSYGIVEGEPRQLVRSQASLTLEPIDIADWSEERLEDAIREEAERPFDLRQDLPIRVCVLRRDAGRWVLLWTLHHIAVDHIAVIKLGESLAQCYTAAADPAPGIAELSRGDAIQYADFAVWQQEELAVSEEMEGRLVHWRRHLEGAPTVLDLPLDHDRPSTQAFEGRELRVELDATLRQPILDAARAAGVSVFVFLLSAFKLTGGAFAGVRDVITGCPFANRSRLELETVVGLFMNLLPIRVAWSDETTVVDLLQATRAAVADGQRFQDTPFEKIVEDLNVTPNPAINPIVQTWFTFQEPPLQLALPGLKTTTTHPHNGGAKLDLSAWLWDSGTTFEGIIEFDTAIFDAASIERLVSVFEFVLRQMAADTTRTTGAISFQPPDHAAQLDAWQGPSRSIPSLSITHGLAQSFAAHADRCAVRDRHERVPYAELQRRAAAIAGTLRDAGVGAGDWVGICVERSVDMVSAVLGVLFSGAAYLPLDPRFPEARLGHIVADSGVRRVLTNESTSALVRNAGAEPILLSEALAGGCSELPVVEQQSDAPAYLIYTSGSTGVPKGVVVPHGAVANFLTAMAAEPGCHQHDVVGAVTTLSFDISVLELLLPLWVGAECFVIDDATSRNGDALVQQLTDAGVTMMQATPSTWRLLLQAKHELPGLRALCGGEPLPPDVAVGLLERVPELWNMYGPTETTVWSTCTRVQQGQPVTIGRPILNTRIRLADDHGKPAPVGAVGEIWIGGRGVSAGYWNRPDLNADRFLADVQDRWYRTGDRGRWLPTGQLQHLGRFDRQLKLRGFRIEPGEVESVLNELPGVSACVVSTAAFSAVDHRLVAYIVPDQDGLPPTSTELRRAAKKRLPEYMVPSAVVTIESVPTLPNGKIDLASLPAPFDGATRARDVPQLRAGVETDVGAIWTKLLKVDTVGPDDSFFDLGGHSLLAMRAVAAMQERLGRVIEPRTLYFQSLRQLVSGDEG